MRGRDGVDLLIEADGVVMFRPLIVDDVVVIAPMHLTHVSEERHGAPNVYLTINLLSATCFLR